jgi:mitogen-activated protein kinase organizer 1
MLLCCSADGSYALSGGQDRIVRLWNPHKGSLVMEYSGAHGYEIADIAVSFDNSRFASVGADKPIFLWDVATANVVRRIRGHDGRINAVQFNAEASVIISASYDQTVKCWDNRSASRDPIQVLADFKDSVTSLCVLPHSIVAGSVDGRVRTFDLRNGKLVTDHIMRTLLLDCQETVTALFVEWVFTCFVSFEFL